MRRRVLLGLLAAGLCACAGRNAPSAATVTASASPRGGEIVELPADIVAGRVFVRPVTADGHTLRFFTDSGGGSQFVFPDTVKRLGWITRPGPAGDSDLDDGAPPSLVAIPAWREGQGIPPALATHQRKELRTHYIVIPRDAFFDAEFDGFLGQGWFGGRVWTIDYPRGKFLHRVDGSVPVHDARDRVPMHLPMAADGQPERAFGRIAITVDGTSLDMLLDTGATLVATPAAARALGDEATLRRGTSFVEKSIFDGWRKRHPEWRVIERAEQKLGSPILEVPAVTVGGHTVGPVWFTSREDHNFRDYMSSMTDAPIVGALGGSALKYFRVTLDYPHGLALFQRDAG